MTTGNSRLEPGPELDALVAEKVMGWKWSGQDGCFLDGDTTRVVEFHPFSTDIRAAWEVVEKFEFGYLYHSDRYLEFRGMPVEPGQWEIRLATEDDRDLAAVADTAPHAICLAALRAVGHDGSG